MKKLTPVWAKISKTGSFWAIIIMTISNSCEWRYRDLDKKYHPEFVFGIVSKFCISCEYLNLNSEREETSREFWANKIGRGWINKWRSILSKRWAIKSFYFKLFIQLCLRYYSMGAIFDRRQWLSRLKASLSWLLCQWCLLNRFGDLAAFKSSRTTMNELFRTKKRS